MPDNPFHPQLDCDLFNQHQQLTIDNLTRVLRTLTDSLVISHRLDYAQGASEKYTTCPSCGSMDSTRHVPDRPEYHAPDCALVAARRLLALGRLTTESEALGLYDTP